MKRQRQFFYVCTRLGPNNEDIVTCSGRDVIFATGNNARIINVGPEQHVKRDGFNVLICEMNMAGMIACAEPIRNINQYTVKRCNPPEGEYVVGPGLLYISDGQALYMNDGCVVENEIIARAIVTGPPPIVNVTVSGSTVIINDGERSINVTGATSNRVGPGEFVRYAGGTITFTGEQFPGISEFCIVEIGSDGKAQFRIVSSLPVTVTGPGHIYIGDDKALFLGDFGDGTTSLSTLVNQQLTDNTFVSNPIGDINVIVNNGNEVITISETTTTFVITGSSMASFSSGQLSFVTDGGQSFQFSGVTQFSVFDNNEVTINPSSFAFSTGGTVFTDSTTNQAVFVSDSNQAAIDRFEDLIPSGESTSYEIETDSDNVCVLSITTGTPPNTDTQPTQTITGSYVMNVDSSETVVYENDEAQVQTFDGTMAVHIGQVNQFFTNTESNPTGNFNFTTSAPTSFNGPGTLSYSRGTGVYTSSRELGNNIGFQSRTAPIPKIRYAATPIDLHER